MSMVLSRNVYLKSLLGAVAVCGIVVFDAPVFAQSGLRESLERLDVDEDGDLEPHEITPLARPYLERVAEVRRMSLDRPNPIEKWQEAARIYYALKNGVAGQSVAPEGENSVKSFGPDPDQPLVPEFGLAEVKFEYLQEDLDEADQTLRRYDRDRDGYIDRAEAARAKWTHRDPFSEDFDNDDRLSRLELGQRYARRRLLSGASDELVQKARRTGNGIRPSSSSEKREDDSRWWRKGGSRFYLTATVLGRFDRNKNGRLEPDEAASLGIPAGRIDADRDGELSRDELYEFLAEMQDEAGDLTDGLPGWFYERDANRDDQVAMVEFTDEWTEEKVQEFTSLDRNGDGLLTASEASQSKAIVGGSYTNSEAQVLPPRKTIISEIVVDEDYLIGDLNVHLSITHSHTSYLDAFLTGPEGQRIELFTEVGGSDDHFDQTVLDDQSRYPITKARPPFKGTFMPEGLLKRQPGLSYFNGKSVNGVWQLVIRCSRSERFGMLHSWGMSVKPQEDMTSVIESAPAVDGPQTNVAPSSGPQANAMPTRQPDDPRMRAAAYRNSPDRMREEFAKQEWAKRESDKRRDFADAKEMDPALLKSKLEARSKAMEKYKKYLEGRKLEGKKSGDAKEFRKLTDKKDYDRKK